MTSFVVAFFVSLAVATLATPLVLRLALRRGLYDMPSDRKVHARPIPRLGGVAIVIAFFAPVTGLLLVNAGASEALVQTESHLLGLYIGGFLIAGLGLYDDLKGANALQKLIVQVGVGALMYALDYRIDAISNPFGGVVELGALSLPVTLFWFVGVINAVNLIDGLDGLAGGIGLISVTTLFALSIMDGNVLASLLCSCLAGAIVGFLFFNFNPARIFMGDTGSLFLGFVLAAFSISTSTKGSTAVALTVPILALGLPILDTMMAIGRRVRAKRNIFSADQEHIHHRLLRAGFSHRNAVITLYIVAGVLAVAALIAKTSSQPIAGLIVLAAGLVLFVLLRVLTQRRPQARDLADPFGHEGLMARAAIDQLAERLRAAPAPIVIGAELGSLAADTHALAVILSDRQRPLFVWQREASTHEALRPMASYRIPLAARGDAEAYVEIRFARGEDHAADLMIALPWERIAPALTEALTACGWAPLQEPVPLPPGDSQVTVLPALADELRELATARRI